MCTNITIKADVEGSAKGPEGWLRIDTAYVSFDHPYHASFEHTLNIDLVNERAEGAARVAVELSPRAARALIESINAALAQGELETGSQYPRPGIAPAAPEDHQSRQAPHPLAGSMTELHGRSRTTGGLLR